MAPPAAHPPGAPHRSAVPTVPTVSPGPSRPAPRAAIPALAAHHLAVVVGEGTRILDDISLSVEKGELLAIVGPSGSGKSTLLKALTGSRPPEEGTIEVRGSDLYAHYDELCRTIGYVPQDDILHLPLTIQDALAFGADLRFSSETTPEQRAHRVDEVLAELELTHRRDVPIEKVSGGQRKRTSVALELLTRPELLFLDEPTSGLDPGFERTVMELLRELATDDRAVVVVTHSLQSLDLCDRVLFLAPGGTIAYFGAPDAALGFFERDDFIDVFRDLENLPPTVWAERRCEPLVPSLPRPPAATPVASPRPVPPAQPWRQQVEILVRRQVAILRADRQNLMFLVGSVIVPAILILLLMEAQTLKLGQAIPVVPRNILGAVVVAAVAIGAANSIREIVKELPIYQRERAIGLQRSAYLTSKMIVLGILTCAQVVVLVIITTLRSGGPGHANVLVIPHLELIVDVMLTGVAAVSLGLVLSTLVSSSEKAMALIPVVFVVQWLFSGAALDLQSKPVLREVAMVTSANWGMAAAASTVNEYELSQSCSYLDDKPLGGSGSGGGDPYADPYSDPYSDPYATSGGGSSEVEQGKEEARREALPTCDGRWAAGIFPWALSVLALLVLIVVPIAAADRLLARKEPLEAQRANDWPIPWKRTAP
ncbi:MAG: modulated efflux pump with fused ATPase and integral rane subunit [Ilumatobacteraceae bacterium]|nr:modulated efflux pump with fused ATPase and integral rane subunit [Ilumatobacteraceae bacterium]